LASKIGFFVPMAKKKISAGLLMYRKNEPETECLLVHPGGPFFKKKDRGVWSIPKGLPDENESLEIAAKREFAEEIGFEPAGTLTELGSVEQKGGKTVYAWAIEGDLPDDFVLTSNTFELEWPPKSGNMQEFPEADRAEFLPASTAKEQINPAQAAFIDRLLFHLHHGV
jgi:predicted NUDIX family NTP pyrophosphohydrolase